jgi:hypothetical protein
MYWDTTTKVLSLSDGTAWIPVGPGGGGAPSGPAGNDLSGTYPNPTVKSATGLPPFTIPGDPSTKAEVTLGSETHKTRLMAPNGAQPWTAWAINTDTYTGSHDNTAKAAWDALLRLDLDDFEVRRKAPTTGALAVVLKLDATGQLVLGNTGTPAVTATGAGGTAKVRMGGMSGTAGGRVSLSANRNYVTGPDDTSKPQWTLDMGADTFDVYRSPAGATHAWANVLSISAAGKTTCSLANGTVTNVMVASGHGIRGQATAAYGGNPAITANAWNTIGSMSYTASGGLCFIDCAVPLSVWPPAGSILIYLAVSRDVSVASGGTIIGGSTAWPIAYGGGGVGLTRLPSITCADYAPAGARTYYLNLYSSTAVYSWSGDGGYRGYFRLVEFL